MRGGGLPPPYAPAREDWGQDWDQDWDWDWDAPTVAFAAALTPTAMEIPTTTFHWCVGVLFLHPWSYSVWLRYLQFALFATGHIRMR